jgi:hypothetical protein
MFSNKLAFTALGAACIMAASTGGYLALRQNAKSTAPVTAGPTQSASSVGSTESARSEESTRGAVADHPVQETESIVSPTASAANPAAAKTPAKATTATPTAAASPKRTAKPAQVLASRNSTPAPVDRTWPGSAASTTAPGTPAQAPQGTPEPVAAQVLRPGDTVIVAQEPAPLPEPPQKSYEELVVSADSVIGLQSETTVSSERARVEDRVEARVTRDVRVGNRVAIPAGSRAIGVVTQVERGGKFKEHARLAIRFQTVVLADGTRLPVSTDAVIREGAAPSNDSSKKIGGGAVAGTILGAILGGAKGAAVGGMVGAGAGAGAVAAGDRSAAMLYTGEPITIRLLSPVTVTSER